MYRKTYEITGYADTNQGCAFCETCVKSYKRKGPDADGKAWLESLTPITLGDEWDAAPTCDRCHAKIEVTEIGGSNVL